MSRINLIGKIYKERNTNTEMKKRADVTLDIDICEVLEQIRSETQFRPSLSEVVNSLLKSHQEIKKRLKKNDKKNKS